MSTRKASTVYGYIEESTEETMTQEEVQKKVRNLIKEKLKAYESLPDAEEDKYVILNEPEHQNAVYPTLHRIKAVKGFKTVTGEEIKAGDLGGYIENESNLSQNGNCWVMPTGTVRGNAKVIDDACIIGDVYENATIADNAIVKAYVHGNAYVGIGCEVSGNAEVLDNAIIFNGSKIVEDGMVSENAIIMGNSIVCGDALVKGDAIIAADVLVGAESVVDGAANIVSMKGEE